MTRTRFAGWRRAMGIIALFGGGVWHHEVAVADVMMMPLEYTVGVGDDRRAMTKPFYSRDMSLFLVRAKIRNASDSDWSGVRIAFQPYVFPTEEPKPSDPSDMLSFDELIPEAAWRPTVELRANGRYLGTAGGMWTVSRSDHARTLNVGFTGMKIHPGDEVDLRVRVTDGAMNVWSLKLTSVTPANPRRYLFGAGAMLGVVGAAGLLLTSRNRRQIMP